MRVYPGEIILTWLFISFLLGTCIGLVHLLGPLVRQLPIPAYITLPLLGALGFWGGVLLIICVFQIGTPIRRFLRFFLDLQIVTLIILLSGLAAVGAHVVLVSRIVEKDFLRGSVGVCSIVVFFSLMQLYSWFLDRQPKKKPGGTGFLLAPSCSGDTAGRRME